MLTFTSFKSGIVPRVRVQHYLRSRQEVTSEKYIIRHLSNDDDSNDDDNYDDDNDINDTYNQDDDPYGDETYSGFNDDTFFGSVAHKAYDYRISAQDESIRLYSTSPADWDSTDWEYMIGTIIVGFCMFYCCCLCCSVYYTNDRIRKHEGDYKSFDDYDSTTSDESLLAKSRRVSNHSRSKSRRKSRSSRRREKSVESESTGSDYDHISSLRSS